MLPTLLYSIRNPWSNIHFPLFLSTSFCVVIKCVQSDETVALNVAPWFSTRALRSAVITISIAFIHRVIQKNHTLFITWKRPTDRNVRLFEGPGGHNALIPDKHRIKLDSDGSELKMEDKEDAKTRRHESTIEEKRSKGIREGSRLFKLRLEMPFLPE